MSHIVIEIKGELWSFICANPNLGSYDILAKYSNKGKTIVNKNFGEKNSIELIGVTHLEVAAIKFAESIYYETHSGTSLVNIKKY